MAATKFLIDDIVLPESLQVAKQFDCAVCLHIAQEPVMQTPCGHVYCKDCLAPCRACPQCREPFAPEAAKPLSEVNKMGLRLLHGIMVRCPYAAGAVASGDPPRVDGSGPAASSASGADAESPPQKRARREDAAEVPQCAWTGCYGDLLAKHLGECLQYPLDCPDGCGAKLKRGELAAHRRVCDKSFEECPICADRIPLGTLPAHKKERAEFHAELLEAKLAEQSASNQESVAVSAHLASVDEQLKKLATKTQLTAHTARLAKVEEQMKEIEVLKKTLEAQQQMSAFWEIKGVKRLLQDFPKKQSKTSQDFQLAGIPGFYLNLEPNGHDDGGAQAHSRLFLHCRNLVSATCKLFMCGAMREIADKKFGGGYGHGANFPLPDDSNTKDDTIVVEVQLLKISRFVSVR